MAASSSPIVLADEDSRLRALYALDLLDTQPEREFDALVLLATQLLDCPTALLTLIDRDRQWVKARTGSDIAETVRSVAFCDHTIRSEAPFIVDDATRDERFAANPLVLDAPHIRFYAGAPIHATGPDGNRHAIGAMCVIDNKPRTLRAEQVRALTHLAAIAEGLIGMRGAVREGMAIAESAREQARVLRRQKRTSRQVERMAMTGSWRYVLDSGAVEWSDGVYHIHELAIGDRLGVERALEFYPPHARAAVSAAMADTIETGRPYELESDFITAKGRQRRVRSLGELEVENGVPVAVIGVFQDVTDRYRVERSLRESAHTDEVTRISNRAAFNRALEAELIQVNAGGALLLVLVDLDGFKGTNDTYGHLAGDDVLRTVGQRLRAPYLGGAFAARLGGDEFALLLTDPAIVTDPAPVIDRLLAHLKTPVQSRDALLPVSGTIGTATAGRGTTPRELMHAADTALYAAKRARRGTAQSHEVRAVQ